MSDEKEKEGANPPCYQHNNQSIYILIMLVPRARWPYIVIVDSHSKWMEAHVVNTATSHATIDKLQLVFATHGLPEVIVSNNGTSFISGKFTVLTQKNGIKHLKSAPYHPASNGLAERAMQTLKNAIKKDSGGVSLETQIFWFLFHYRITPHSTTGVTPAKAPFPP